MIRKMNNNKGFTLIELLIVIGIIAILAAAVIIAINPGRQFQQARNATRWSHMNSIVNSVYSYAISEGGNFPDCNNGIDDLDSGNPRDVGHCEGELVPDFMSALPHDPQEGGVDNDNCELASSSDCTGYVIELIGGNRISITSVADEANETGSEVEVIQ